MQFWPVPSAAPSTGGGAAATVETGMALIGCVAREDFGPRALAALNRTLPVAWWTVTRRPPDRPPQLCAQASHVERDIVGDCWRLYHDGIWREDDHLQRACSEVGRVALAHSRAEDFSAAQRERIYAAHALRERLSVATADRSSSGGLLAINLYRHRAQPGFGAAEIDAVHGLAGTLLAVVERHLELAARSAAPADRLRAACPTLTPREVEVCERLLRGWSFDGIAADLGVSAATAKTYRNRAFGRLGIHHRHELAARLATAHDRADR